MSGTSDPGVTTAFAATGCSRSGCGRREVVERGPFVFRPRNFVIADNKITMRSESLRPVARLRMTC
jgi:hypothetical protein